MWHLEKSIAALCRELEAERVENAKFRRMMEDILYNLEEENMPGVAARLVKGEKSIGLLVEDGQVRGAVLVQAINGASGVTIDADKIDLNGNLLVQRINNGATVTIDADKIDLNGNLLVQRINNGASVTIDADRINLNGAVTANENFKIHEDGSASCKALEVTGGRISLPDPADGSSVLEVHTENEAGGVTVYADRIAFSGQFTQGWDQEAMLSLGQLSFANRVEGGDGNENQMAGYYRPGEIYLTWASRYGSSDSMTITPRYVQMPYLANNPRTKTAGMRPVYIDENGRLCAVEE